MTTEDLDKAGLKEPVVFLGSPEVHAMYLQHDGMNALHICAWLNDIPGWGGYVSGPNKDRVTITASTKESKTYVKVLYDTEHIHVGPDQWIVVLPQVGSFTPRIVALDQQEFFTLFPSRKPVSESDA